jgi:hypothetical protein
MEYSACSTILTEFLESKGIKHVNVMHGHKEFNVKDTCFSGFHICLIWGKYYKNLFNELKMRTGKYCYIGHPTHRAFYNIDIFSDICRKESVVFILNQESSIWLDFKILGSYLKEKKIPVYFKPHPIYDKNAAKNYFGNTFGYNSILNGTSFDALSEHEIIIGNKSTILMEAWLAGNKVVMYKCNAYSKSCINGTRALRINSHDENALSLLYKFIVSKSNYKIEKDSFLSTLTVTPLW